MKKNKKKEKRVQSILGFNSVEVLGHTLRVTESGVTDDLVYNGSLCFGLYKPIESEIVISTRQSPENMRQVFYHELLHAIDFLSHNEEYKYDEEVVNVLGRGLATVRLD